MNTLLLIATGLLALLNSLFIARIKNEDMRAGFTAIVTFLIIVTAFVSGLMLMSNRMQNHAARIGAGRYEADPITGETEFKWNKED